MSDVLALSAPCDGTVYAWHYCYYPENSENDVQVAFGVYEHIYMNDQFILRPESYYLLHLDVQEATFTCETVTLSPSQYFQIYEGDRVGACMRSGEFDFLDVLARNAPSTLRVAMWGGDSGSCGVNDTRYSPSRPVRQATAILHLSVDISKLKNTSTFSP